MREIRIESINPWTCIIKRFNKIKINKVYKSGKQNRTMEKDIGRIKKNETTEIVVRVDDYKGKKGVTIREFVQSDRYTGFTKSGTRIPAGDFLKFREMINSISLDELKSEEGKSNSKDKEEEIEAEEDF